MAIDIYQKVEQDFKTDAAAAHEELSKLDAMTKGLISDRLIRAIVYMADGNLDALREYIKKSRNNWQQVIDEAEYDPDAPERKRDFNKTFHELKLYRKK